METIFVRRSPDSVMEWTAEDVADWLKQLRLDKYCKRFQSHLVTGPVILQMDDLLLDDLHITVAEEREMLLRESRKLCLQELDMVNQALRYKQNSQEFHIPFIHISACEDQHRTSCDDREIDVKKPGRESKDGEKDDMEKITKNDCDANGCSDDKCYSSEADEVATRATMMVDILSQENSHLRMQLEESVHNICLNQQLNEKVTKLQEENNNLINQVRRYEHEKRKLEKRIQDLSRENFKLQDSLNQQDVELESMETEMGNLKQNNRLIRDKYQRLKFEAVEREMSKKASNGTNTGNLRSQVSSSVSTVGNLQLVEKVYQANKRCAELEDTVRWLYKAILMENKHYKLPANGAFQDTSEPDDLQDPSEPEWPSLTTWTTPNTSGLSDRQNNDILQRLISRGLPTDVDDDIWGHRV